MTVHSVVSLLKLLGNESRLKIAVLLVDGEKSGEQLIHATGLNIQSFTHHLARFRHRDLIKCRRTGKIVMYSLDDPEGKFARILRNILVLYFRKATVT